MAKPTNVLDGPRMGYGPVQQQGRTGIPISTVVLGVICLLLAAALALSIAGRYQSNQTQLAAATAGPSTTSSGDIPAGAPDATDKFLDAWTLPAGERDNALAAVTVTGLSISPAATAALSKQRPAGTPQLSREDSRGPVTARQTLADGSTVQLQLEFDQAAVYGWLVTSVQLV